MRGKRIILTGAAGGITAHLARLLAAEGARLCLTDINEQALEEVRQALLEVDAATIAADITSAEGRQSIVDEALQKLGGIDVLINAAGINPFGVFANQDPDMIEKTLEINAIAPILMTRAVLPVMLEQDSGQIVNIGSTFGSIGFAWFSAYSASKYALRGFSQALRRELAETGVAVSYVAPRAVRTAINSPQVYAMAKAVNMKMDEPDAVAEQIVKAVRKGKKERYLGFPESLFVRINAVLPGLVDGAVRGQNRKAHKHAEKSG